MLVPRVHFWELILREAQKWVKISLCLLLLLIDLLKAFKPSEYLPCPPLTFCSLWYALYGNQALFLEVISRKQIMDAA